MAWGLRGEGLRGHGLSGEGFRYRVESGGFRGRTDGHKGVQGCGLRLSVAGSRV